MSKIRSSHGSVVDSTDLSDDSSAKVFYDTRYSAGYMESWPEEKCLRVAGILRGLPLPSSGRVLDFGCGTAVFTATLKQILGGWDVHGTDISPNALEAAAKRLPGCTFRQLDELNDCGEQFDLIFTHHVLEHVADLKKVAFDLSKLLTSSGMMLHILPCADAGSLEHCICSWRKDGFVGEKETRFFHDEEGHLRRLSTEELAALWSDYGLLLKKAYYANHWYGGIKFLTGKTLQFLLNIVDPEAGTSPFSAQKLRILKLVLVTIWIARQPLSVLKNKKASGCRGLRDYILFLLATLAFPLSKTTDWIVEKLAAREWSTRRTQSGGSEMYLFFVRTAKRDFRGRGQTS